MAKWHPIQNARESPVGTWSMEGPLEKVYATITLVRRGDELGYRVVNENGGTVGYYRTLMAASSAAHTWFISTAGPHGIPAAGYAGKAWNSDQPRP